MTLIKYMKKEELIKMMKSIKKFKMDGRAPKGNTDPNLYWRRAKHNVQIENIDYIDVLLCDEGYVRVETERYSDVYNLFILKYRFYEETY